MNKTITIHPDGSITIVCDVDSAGNSTPSCIKPLPPKCVAARDIPAGGYFRKKNGWMVYLRMATGSSDFLLLSHDRVYGIAHNGNVTNVSQYTEVERMQHADFLSCARLTR